jgi:hypothetical protein
VQRGIMSNHEENWWIGDAPPPLRSRFCMLDFNRGETSGRYMLVISGVKVVDR